MSALTTLTTALQPKPDPGEPTPTKEARRQSVVEYYAWVLTQDKFAHVGKCRSTGKEVTICYNTHGDPHNPCLLLVQGLSTSLVGWPIEMINYFVANGFFVVRYDNRDVGRSTSFSEFGNTNILRMGLPAWASIGEKMIYNLEDMMEDGMGLMTALKVEKFHVLGMSMGGMLVSLMAIHHPERVLSLNIFCSHLGGKDEVQPGYATYARFIVPPKSKSPYDQAQHMVWFLSFLSQGQYRSEEEMEELRDAILAGYKRDGVPDILGNVRQIQAIQRATSRRVGLEKVTVPTVVMHGLLDPLIPAENGRRIARAVKGSKLVLFPRLGHDLPEAIQLDIAAEVVLNMKRVPS